MKTLSFGKTLPKHNLLSKEDLAELDILAEKILRPKKWNFNSCKKEARKYNTRKEFAKGSGGAYYWARVNKKLEEVCGHMEVLRREWTLESVKKEAKKYNTRREFEKGSLGAYSWALRNGLLDEVCGHMEVLQKEWDLESVKEEAKKYNTRNEFQKGSRGAYNWAWRNKKLDEVCSHMDNKLLNPFSKKKFKEFYKKIEPGKRRD